MSIKKLLGSGLGFLSLIILMACGKDNRNDYDPDTSYWSINQFIIDQYNLLVGEPIALTKVVTLNERTDTTYIALDNVDWATIFKVFGATDISDPKYYNLYNYSHFDDNFLEMSTMSYTAKDPELYVRRLDINYDNETRKISLIYIETSENNMMHDKQQKLSYYVRDKIVIQESERSKFSEDKELTVIYKFP